MVAITLADVGSRLTDGTDVLRHLNLSVRDGELLALVGPSGSGKTTILRLIAGLEQPTSGSIFFDGESVGGVAPSQRNVAMVFQDGALFSHLSAGENIGFPLRVRRVGRAETARRVGRQARHIGVANLLTVKPAQLSAGHRHSVATARALVSESHALLLDEPLSSLDARARQRVRSEVVRLHRELGATMVYVTNDTTEAMAIGERVAVLDDEGNLRQVAAPERVYRSPRDTFVASFVGSINLVRSHLEWSGEDTRVDLGTDRVRLDSAFVARHPQLRQFGDVLIGCRPEHLALAQPGTPFDRCVHGRVLTVANLGGEQRAVVVAGAEQLEIRIDRARPLFAGDPVELAVNVDRLLFFDPATGLLVTP